MSELFKAFGPLLKDDLLFSADEVVCKYTYKHHGDAKKAVKAKCKAWGKILEVDYASNREMEEFSTIGPEKKTQFVKTVRSDEWRNHLRNAEELDLNGRIKDANEKYKFVYTSSIGNEFKSVGKYLVGWPIFTKSLKVVIFC